MNGNKKKLIIITATHKDTGKNATLYYKSIEQAQYFNPSFYNFREVGFKT